MTDPIDLSDPIATLLAVVDALSPRSIDSAVYGGLALAVYGEPRETKDADLAVAGAEAAAVESALTLAGLGAKLAFDRVRFGGNVVSRLSLLGGDSALGLNVVDLVQPLSERYAKLVVSRALEGTLRGRPVRVVSPEDFVLLKVLSTRERDIEDATSVLRSLGSRVSVTAIRLEAVQLAGEIPDHDVSGRLSRVLADAVATGPGSGGGGSG